MSTFWLLIKIAVYGFLLKCAYRWSHNLLFVIAKKPLIWIGFVAVLGAANIVLAYLMKWDPRLVGIAVIIAVIFNIETKAPEGFKGNWKETIDDFWNAAGIPKGRVLSKTGLVVFALASLTTYVLLFGEITTA